LDLVSGLVVGDFDSGLGSGLDSGTGLISGLGSGLISSSVFCSFSGESDLVSVSAFF
jgi:hypothetical protein